jgi:hypothetical protein
MYPGSSASKYRGRSAAARSAEPVGQRNHTRYLELLMDGLDAGNAVRESVDRIAGQLAQPGVIGVSEIP